MYHKIFLRAPCSSCWHQPWVVKVTRAMVARKFLFSRKSYKEFKSVHYRRAIYLTPVSSFLFSRENYKKLKSVRDLINRTNITWIRFYRLGAWQSLICTKISGSYTYILNTSCISLLYSVNCLFGDCWVAFKTEKLWRTLSVINYYDCIIIWSGALALNLRFWLKCVAVHKTYSIIFHVTFYNFYNFLLDIIWQN